MRCYIYVFCNTLQPAAIDAWFLGRRYSTQRKKMPLPFILFFFLLRSSKSLEMFEQNVYVENITKNTTPPQKKARVLVPGDVRECHSEHWQGSSGKRYRCRQSDGAYTFVKCRVCGSFLWIDEDGSWILAYHAKWKTVSEVSSVSYMQQSKFLW